MKKKQGKTIAVFIVALMAIIAVSVFLVSFTYFIGKNFITNYLPETEAPQANFRLLLSSENKDLEKILTAYADSEKIDLELEYAGTIEIMDKLNNNEQYDAVWFSNSIWLYMLENGAKVVNSKSTSINPIVFAIRKDLAANLGFVDKDVYTKDILKAISSGKLKFVMASATQTNTGASAYLGFLAALANNPEVLTEEHLQNEQLLQDVGKLLGGVNRTSGSDEFLEELLEKGAYDAFIAYESSIINYNQKLLGKGETPYFLVYPVDGVSISDSPLAYINNKDPQKQEIFTKLQNYILGEEGQQKLAELGRRTWFGGTNKNADQQIFNRDWGIDTEKYLIPIKYPNTKVIREALSLYQSGLRKPSHTIFCLDFSGSMYGTGNYELVKAMDYILNEESAKVSLLQFSPKDKVSIILFDDMIMEEVYDYSGDQAYELMSTIRRAEPRGFTNLYDPLVNALNKLNDEDQEELNVSIVLMTDGRGNTGTFQYFSYVYHQIDKDIPIYAIMFGSAYPQQLEEIVELSGGRVFDGRIDLLRAFKEVRGYN